MSKRIMSLDPSRTDMPTKLPFLLADKAIKILRTSNIYANIVLIVRVAHKTRAIAKVYIDRTVLTKVDPVEEVAEVGETERGESDAAEGPVGFIDATTQRNDACASRSRDNRLADM